MNNKVFFSVITGVLASSGIIAALQFGPSSASAHMLEEEAKQKVSSQFPGEIVELELDEHGNKKVYEVEVEGKNGNFELVIDAETGEIIQVEEMNSSKDERDDDDDERVQAKGERDDNDERVQAKGER
ncbi:PepSY domain-containing protein, partial [Pontibacillus litoralis]